VSIKLDAVFRDKRHPDLDNLLKVTCDAVKEGLGIDDKYFTHETGAPIIGGEPKLIITIRGVKDE